MSAGTAILKGVLESEVDVSILTGCGFGGRMCQRLLSTYNLARSGSPAGRGSDDLLFPVDVLRQHDLRLVDAPSASLAVSLAASTTRSSKNAIALIANHELDGVVVQLNRLMSSVFHPQSSDGARSGAMVVILEDDPSGYPASCAVRATQRLNWPCLQPGDLRHLRDSIEPALRLSRAARSPSVIVTHESIMRSLDTLDMYPNRVMQSVDAMLARRKRRSSAGTKWTEAAGVLRAARRLELNRFRAVPNPGERVAVGFITVGPADVALQHITHALDLHGRVPVLQLGLVHPVDDSAVGRLLLRCQRVVVLEPRPGAVEAAVLAVAESMRHKGEQPATIWGQDIPVATDVPKPDATDIHAAPDIADSSDLHPSILVRRIAHLLHAIRPTAQVALQLQPEPPDSETQPMPRATQIGLLAALNTIRRTLIEVDQVLREQPVQNEDDEPIRTGFVIDGAEPIGNIDRIVNVEVWDHSRFVTDGPAAVVHASMDSTPWLLVISEATGDPISDLERFARGLVPAAKADRVSILAVDLNDRTAMRNAIRTQALTDRVTILIVRDGPPAAFDATAVTRELAEVDRLGFEPRQRVVRHADDACAIRSPQAHEASDSDHTPVSDLAETDVAAGLARSFEITPASAGFSIQVRPLLEEVEVIRTRPPLMSWRSERSASKLPTPIPLQANASQWRVHLAGTRDSLVATGEWSNRGGPVVMTLCEAGRLMGYQVRCIVDPTPIAPGRAAWAQLLFTQPAPAGVTNPFATTIPFGEADLLMGIDALETYRAVTGDRRLRVASPERTYIVADVEDRSGTSGRTEPGTAQDFTPVVRTMCRADRALLQDVSGACRTWFHTDRVTDMAMLGAAFQLGLVPVSSDAMEQAVMMLQGMGFGRSREAFEFGRRLVVHPELFDHAEDERHEILERMIRRIVLSLSRGEWGGGSRARNFHALLTQSLHAMPGLGETEPGREALEDFVLGCHRCRIWGGYVYAQRYAELITRLYVADRGDTGRLLTRLLILPVAEIMLFRDAVFIAGMANSSEQRRALRQMLNAKLARGDRMERRYLTRIECTGFKRRVRIDLRTSDWPARAVSALRRVIPQRWRGTKRDRDLREYLVEIVKRIIEDKPHDYERWIEPARRLHHYAMEGRLRGAALAEMRMLIGDADRTATPSGSSLL